MISRWVASILTISLSVAPACAASRQAATATVNSYTPAQEEKAEAAVKAAGYDPGKVLFAQAGNFFFNGIKDGQSYGITVTPDGRVFASTPLPLPSGAATRPS